MGGYERPGDGRTIQLHIYHGEGRAYGHHRVRAVQQLHIVLTVCTRSKLKGAMGVVADTDTMVHTASLRERKWGVRSEFTHPSSTPECPLLCRI